MTFIEILFVFDFLRDWYSQETHQMYFFGSNQKMKHLKNQIKMLFSS